MLLVIIEVRCAAGAFPGEEVMLLVIIEVRCAAGAFPGEEVMPQVLQLQFLHNVLHMFVTINI